MMKRTIYLIAVLSLCGLSAFGATQLALDLTGSSDVAAFAAVAAFIGNLFMIEPIQSPFNK